MKKILPFLLVALLAGCDRPVEHTTEIFDYESAPGMEGCHRFLVMFSNGSGQTVWRCPNSTTTSSQGKGAPVTVIDGDMK